MKKYVVKLTSQTGDTIVEVIMALTVLSLVLATSSVLANKNARTLQTSQEYAVALRIAQEQLELIRSSPDVMSNPGEFCVQNGIDGVSRKSAGDSACKRQNGAAEYQIKAAVNNVGRDKIAVKVSWETLGSGVPGSLTLPYGLNP